MTTLPPDHAPQHGAPPQHAPRGKAKHVLPDASVVDPRIAIQQSGAFLRTLELCRMYARVRRPIVFVGPIGVGKSTLAKLIHKLSGRAGRFISCSAGEIGDSLAHSFLFGHVRGAFTGAIGSRTGVFESAASGTLLLDDFANLSTPVQCALLRVLEERAFTPVGASRDVPVTCRELYATTQSLETLAREDTLVPDFLSRIGEMVIEIPPLRERPEDILPLAEYYLVCAAHEFEREPGTLSADVCQLFVEYPWPHNIRELKGVIERAVIHAHDEGSPEVTPDHIPERLLHGIGQPSAKQPMSEELVVKTLIKTDGNVSATARELQRHRNTVYRYLPARARRKKLSVDDPRL